MHDKTATELLGVKFFPQPWALEQMGAIITGLEYLETKGLIKTEQIGQVFSSIGFPVVPSVLSEKSQHHSQETSETPRG